MSLHPGSKLGPYQVVALLGAGGMGEVYRAYDPKLERDVAIKVLPASFAESRERIQRFRQEARTLASLSHPNIVQIHDAGEHDGSSYLVMELLPGETLRTILSRGPLPWRKAVEMAAALADGLAAAHAKGIIHRDLKPENIMVDEDGRPRLLDFGLAKLRPLSIETATTLPVVTDGTGTLEGALMGTVGYMSPEQVQGQPVDPRSDLFSLGAVLYEMVTGKRAFQGRSAAEVLSAILLQAVAPPSLSGSGGTPGLDHLLSHCLEKAPRDRFQSAKDLAFALRALLGSGSVNVVALLAWSPRLRRWSARAAAALIACLCAYTGLVLWRSRVPGAPPCDPRCLVILPFENRSGDPSMDNVGRQALDFVRQDLKQVENLKVVAETGASPGSEEGDRRLAKASAARFAASLTCFRQGDGVEFQASLMDPWDGKTLYVLGPWPAPEKNPALVLPEVRQALAGAVAWSYNEFFGMAPGSVRPPKLDAYFPWLKGMNSIHLYLGSCGAESSFSMAQALDPDFLQADLCLVDSLVSMGRDEDAGKRLAAIESAGTPRTAVERLQIREMRARFEGRAIEALQTLRDIATLIPDSNFLRLQRAILELRLNLVRDAIRDLAAIPSDWIPRSAGFDYWPSYYLCEAHHMAGDYRAQLDLARRSQKRFPDVLDFWVEEFDALVAMGHLDALDKVFNAALTVPRRLRCRSVWGLYWEAVAELQVHGHGEVSRTYAKRWLAAYQAAPPGTQANLEDIIGVCYVQLGMLEEALAQTQSLLKKYPERMDPSAYAGVACTLARLGRLAEARAMEDRLANLPMKYPRGRISFYRATVLAQLGEKEKAVELLRKSIGEGCVFQLDFFGHRELDLDPLRGYPPFEDLMSPKN